MTDRPASRLSAGNRVAAKAVGNCPICEKHTEREFRPFCSRHCADLDLHRWLQGRYAIPASDDENIPDDDDVRH